MWKWWKWWEEWEEWKQWKEWKQSSLNAMHCCLFWCLLRKIYCLLIPPTTHESEWVEVQHLLSHRLAPKRIGRQQRAQPWSVYLHEDLPRPYPLHHDVRVRHTWETTRNVNNDQWSEGWVQQVPTMVSMVQKLHRPTIEWPIGTQHEVVPAWAKCQ